MRGDDYGKAGLAAATLALATLVYLATCSSAKAAPYTIRFQNPGAERPYDVLGVCGAAGCAEQSIACGPGATCSATTDLAVGVHSVWLVGGNGADRTAASNVREIAMPAGCEWNLDAAGGVTTADFGIFLTRFRAGAYTVADFGRFFVAYSTPGLACP